MRKVTGLGGVFFKAKDPKVLSEWYRDHLGLPISEYGGADFDWLETQTHAQRKTVWSTFPADTDYFKESSAPFMINYIVEDLDALLDALSKEGVRVDSQRDDSEFGRFAWIWDPEGNRIELWEPPSDGAKSAS